MVFGRVNNYNVIIVLVWGKYVCILNVFIYVVSKVVPTRNVQAPAARKPLTVPRASSRTQLDMNGSNPQVNQQIEELSSQVITIKRL